MKSKKIKIGIISVVVVVVLGGLAFATFMPRTINVSDYLYAKVEGVSGKGQLEYYMQDYFPEELEVKVKANKTKDIRNGDVISFDISWNEDKCKEYGITLKNNHKEWKIGGLKDYSSNDGKVKEGHNFYASTDMNDAISKVMLDTVRSELEEELRYLSDAEYVINTCSVLGIYADNDTGIGTKVLTKFNVSNDEWDKKELYLCTDFYELTSYITGDDVSTFNTDNIDALENKTGNHVGISTFYAESREEVDIIMNDDNLSFIEYEYTYK